MKDIIINWEKYLIHNMRYSQHTIRAYKSDVLYFINFISLNSTPSLELMQQLNIQNFRAWLSHKKKTEVKSLSRAFSAVKNFFKYLKLQYQIENHHLQNIKLREASKPLPKALLEEEVSKILNLTESGVQDHEEWINCRNHVIMLILYGCGLRIGEVLNLKIKEFIQDDVILLKTKGNKERYVYTLPFIKEKVNQYIKLCPYDLKTAEYLFLGARGKKLNAGVFRTTMQDLRQSFGLPSHASPHALRHSFATHLINAGVNIRVIQDLLGHENLNSTQKYTKVSTATLRQCYDKFHPRNRIK